MRPQTLLRRADQWRLRFMARQFARPRGLVGRWLLGPWLNRVNRSMNALALRALDVKQGERVVEIGFGGGDLLASLLGTGASRVVGVDLSPEMVARARKRFRRQIADGRLSVLLGSVDDLPLEAASIDKACSLHTLYFWQDPAAGMRELARILRPGGTLVIGIEAPETLRNWPGHRYGFTVYEPGEVIALAAAAGLVNPVVAEAVEEPFGRILTVKVERR